MKYPKLPDGPSAVGAAGVRAIQSVGGDFQVKQLGSSAKAFLKGEFSKVTTGGVEYVVHGYSAFIDDSAGLLGYFYKTRAEPVYGAGFGGVFEKIALNTTSSGEPEEWGQHFIPMGKGMYCRASKTTSVENVRYERIGGSEVPGAADVYDIPIYSHSVTVYTTGFTQKTKSIGTFDIRQSNGGRNLNLSSIPLYYGGEFDVGGKTEKRILSVIPTLEDRDMDVNFEPPLPFTSLRIVSMADGREPIQVPVEIPFFSSTSPTTNRCAVAVTENHTAIVLAEDRQEEDESYAHRTWLVKCAGHNLSSQTALDVNGALGEPMYASGGDFMDKRMGWHLPLVLPDDVVLLFRPQAGGVGVPILSERSWEVLRLDLSGGMSASLLYTHPGAEGDFETRLFSNLVHDAVYLGDGKVLAKVIRSKRLYDAAPNYPGEVIEVTFFFSSDFGATWMERTPTGLNMAEPDASLIGYMTVHKPAKDGKPATVLLAGASMTGEKRGHCIYESKDHGASWKFKVLTLQVEGFGVDERPFSVSTFAVQGGGLGFTTFEPDGNWGRINPGDSLVRPLDIAIPKRYKKA